MLPFKTTSQAADELGCTLHRVVGLIRFKKMTPPAKDGAGSYVWFPEDIERARQALEATRCVSRARRDTGM